MPVIALIVGLLLSPDQWKAVGPHGASLEREYGTTIVATSTPSDVAPSEVLFITAAFTADEPRWIVVYSYEGMDNTGIDLRRRLIRVTDAIKESFRSFRSTGEYDRLSALYFASLIDRNTQESEKNQAVLFRLPSPPTTLRISIPKFDAEGGSAALIFEITARHGSAIRASLLTADR